MKNFRFRIASSISLFWLLIVAGFSANAQQLDSRMIEDWEARWERVVQKALGGYVDRAAASYLAPLDDETQSHAVNELVELLYSAVSWEALGGDLVSNMQSECGIDLLSEMEPYFVDGDTSTISPDVISAYSQCASTAMQSTVELLMLALQSKEPQIEEIHSKYGIDNP